MSALTSGSLLDFLDSPNFCSEGFAEELALVIAAGRGSAEVVRYLLDHGVGIDAQDSNSKTPIMAAVLGGHASVARLLYERGADPDKGYGKASKLREKLAALIANADNAGGRD